MRGKLAMVSVTTGTSADTYAGRRRRYGLVGQLCNAALDNWSFVQDRHSSTCLHRILFAAAFADARARPPTGPPV